MDRSIATKNIESRIFFLREKKVMLDEDLAYLYKVSTKNLNKAVKRNRIRFPGDFMFQLTAEEANHLRFQFGTSNWGGRRYLPYAFTEQGVAMLSSVLKSERAALVNIAIMRAFVRVGRVLLTHKELVKKLEELEKRLQRHDRRFDRHAKEIRMIFAAIQALLPVFQGEAPGSQVRRVARR
jgi:hypothetical protein